MKSIKERAEIARDWLKAAQGNLNDIQRHCPHENKTKKYGANTGNYDPSADCYWTDFTCQDCGKKWTKDGSK